MSQNPIVQRALRFVLAIVWVGVVVFVFMYLIAYTSRIYRYGALSNGNRSLYVVELDNWYSSYGSINISDSKNDINIVFYPVEWERLMRIWQTARSNDKPGWTTIGDIVETDTNNTSRLFIIAGPSMRFVLRQGSDCVDYDLPKSNYAEFDRALSRVRNHFAGHITAGAQSSSAEKIPSDMVDTITDWSAVPPAIARCN